MGQAGELRAQLAEMLRTEDLYEAEAIAHKLAGSCELLGLDASARRLRAIEKTAAADDLLACRALREPFDAGFEAELAAAREFAPTFIKFWGYPMLVAATAEEAQEKIGELLAA